MRANGAGTNPPRNSVPDPVTFEAQGRSWIAFPAGTGVAGTGRFTARALQLIRFAPADQPERPVAEVITPLLDLTVLHPAELADLLAAARPISEESPARYDETGPTRLMEEPPPDEVP